jgi:hypothetical protein
MLRPTLPRSEPPPSPTQSPSGSPPLLSPTSGTAGGAGMRVGCVGREWGSAPGRASPEQQVHDPLRRAPPELKPTREADCPKAQFARWRFQKNKFGQIIETKLHNLKNLRSHPQPLNKSTILRWTSAPLGCQSGKGRTLGKDTCFRT